MLIVTSVKAWVWIYFSLIQVSLFHRVNRRYIETKTTLILALWNRLAMVIDLSWCFFLFCLTKSFYLLLVYLIESGHLLFAPLNMVTVDNNNIAFVTAFSTSKENQSPACLCRDSIIRAGRRVTAAARLHDPMETFPHQCNHKMSPFFLPNLLGVSNVLRWATLMTHSAYFR